MCEQKEKKGKNKSISKKRRKESQVKVKLNFKRKQGKQKHHKKDHPKIIGNIEHDNMLSMSVCDTCKISISNAILHCNSCLKDYHPYFVQPMFNFPDKFPNQTFVYPNCIHNNNSSSHHFVSRAGYCMFYGSQDFIKEQCQKVKSTVII